MHSTRNDAPGQQIDCPSPGCESHLAALESLLATFESGAAYILSSPVSQRHNVSEPGANGEPGYARQGYVDREDPAEVRDRTHEYGLSRAGEPACTASPGDPAFKPALQYRGKPRSSPTAQLDGEAAVAFPATGRKFINLIVRNDLTNDLAGKRANF